MELNDDTLSSMTDKLIEEKAVEQYVQLGKLAVQLIPQFNVMQSDKELCLHKFLMTESSDDEKLVILTDWVLNKVVGILAIMHAYVNKTFKDGLLPLFAITGEDSEENENLKKYGILIFNYKK